MLRSEQIDIFTNEFIFGSSSTAANLSRYDASGDPHEIVLYLKYIVKHRYSMV